MSGIPKSPFAFARYCSRSVRRWAIGACLAVCGGIISSRVMVYLVKVLTDSATQFNQAPEAKHALWIWVLLFAGVYLVGEWIWRVSGFCGMRWISGVGAQAYRELFRYLTGHSSSYFSDRYAGALINKISNASKGTEQLIAQALWQVMPLSLGLLSDIYLSAISHRYFGYILVSWSTIYIGLNVWFVRKLNRLSFEHAESSSTLKGKIVDSATNIEAVQLAAEQEFERRHIDHYIGMLRSAHLAEWWASEWVLVTNGVMLFLFILAMLSCGAWLLGSGAISVGSLVLIITVVINLEQRFFFLGQQLTNGVTSYGQVREGLAELLEPHAIKDVDRAAQLNVLRGRIEFSAVTFAYRDNEVFRDLSLVVEPGQKIGLVGKSGAGKSTLVNLLLRQFEAQRGKILIDGQDISQVTLESLRRSIAVVPQSTNLFHRSIRDNIRYGRLDAGDEQVRHASELAHAHEFITRLENGYDSFVGERGVKLSGGQRQRVAIARAIIKRAPILVLDEATSSLDSESEEAIQRGLAELMSGKTVIAIAHRLSTLKSMDRIVVLDNGRVVEDGTHQELLAKRGIYTALWETQVSGFVGG